MSVEVPSLVYDPKKRLQPPKPPASVSVNNRSAFTPLATGRACCPVAAATTTPFSPAASTSVNATWSWLAVQVNEPFVFAPALLNITNGPGGASGAM